MRVLGIDPGITGGLSIVEMTDGAAPVLVETIDIPVTGSGAKERVDVAGIRNFIEAHHPARALIERAGAMPKQGIASTFKYGRATGAIEAAITLCSIPVEIIEASAWKRFWHLPGKDKESARQGFAAVSSGACRPGAEARSRSRGGNTHCVVRG
jgi:crossover junction endodeoxyribonuclease RuvC